MSKKDYQAIAGAVHEVHSAAFRTAPAGVSEGTDWFAHAIADRLADVLQADNPRFDRARFIEACETGKCKGMKAQGVDRG